MGVLQWVYMGFRGIWFEVMPPLRLGSVDGKPFDVDADVVVTGRTCVIGASGSGKSYAVGVLCEELCRVGVRFALVDTEGEHIGLKRKYEAVWVGEDEGCDLKWSGFDPAEVGSHILEAPPLILDVSETDDPQVKVARFVSALYEQVSARRVPYLLIVEEADKFVPQYGDRLEILGEVARRGRKRGLGLMVCTQRPSLVDKNVLSQCGNQLIGKLVIRNDLQAVEQFFQGRGLPEQLTTLQPGYFYAAGGFSAVPVCVKIRERETPPGGSAPKLGQEVELGTGVSEWLGRFTLTRSDGEGVGVPRTRRTIPTEDAQIIPQKVLKVGLEGASNSVRLGLRPLISASDAALYVKRERSFPLFGREETVSSVQLVMRPLLELGIRGRIRSGLLRHRYETRFAVFDGVSGCQADVSGTLTIRGGLEKLIGLSEEEVAVLRCLDTGTPLGVVDLALRAKIPEGAVRKHLASLVSRRLAGSRRVGRTKVFYRLVDIPVIKQSERSVQLGDVGSFADAQIQELRVGEAELREVIRGLLRYSEVESCKPFLYPLYRVELVLRDKTRVEWVDARSGGTVEL
jgi:hypothetical protein